MGYKSYPGKIKTLARGRTNARRGHLTTRCSILLSDEDIKCLDRLCQIAGGDYNFSAIIRSAIREKAQREITDLPASPGYYGAGKSGEREGDI